MTDMYLALHIHWKYWMVLTEMQVDAGICNSEVQIHKLVAVGNHVQVHLLCGKPMS